jgi:Domain of unknown function (DUF4293)
MIQRIQTVYLLLAELLIGVLFFVPFADISAQDGTLYFIALEGLGRIGTTTFELPDLNWLMMLFLVSSITLLTRTILLYKNRKLQIKLAFISLVISLLIAGLIVVTANIGAQHLSGHFSLTIYSAFPMIAAILLGMAIRGIRKDEELVRSIDRIR